MVIIPDYYRGTICDVTKEEFETIMAFLRNESVWEGKLKEDWEKSICPYATENGAKSFGTIGKYNIAITFETANISYYSNVSSGSTRTTKYYQSYQVTKMSRV